jgi:hypothetical protein
LVFGWREGALPWRCFGGDLADQGGNGLNRSATDERADDAPDGGVGCNVALFAQDRAELFLAPHGMIQAQPLDGCAQALRTPGLAQATRPPAQRRGALVPAVEGGAREAHRFGRLLAGQPLRHGLAPARQRIADNMAGQAKNLHGVLSGLKTYGTVWSSWLIGERDIGLGLFRQGAVGSMMVIELLIAAEDGVELVNA